ncbi:S1 family peptidase [Gigaspora margarita]|uniref:S1 family peptidase n=1 Tax=Gigaspora margarita TaxID=4874 RepID=A0A8H4B5B9_GIGMA|nr:S1 family peptidase [Gigaspora margarita]
MCQTIAILWGINDTEVPTLLELEKNLTTIDDILRPILEEDEFISSFGGTYIDTIEDETYLVVNTVNNSKVDELLKLPQISPYENFLYFLKANKSMSQIKYNFDKIAAITQSLKPRDVLVYIDMKINDVVVFIFNTGTIFNNTEYINAVDPFNPSIIYESTPSAPQNILRPQHDARFLNIIILGGDGLYIKNNNNNSDNRLCSAGFWTSDRNNPPKKYIITAGHCVENFSNNASYFLQPWNSTKLYVSYIGSSVYNPINFYDIGIVDVENEDFSPRFAIRNTDDQYKELIIVDGVPVFSHGVHICKSGRTSHFTCGYVLGLNGIYSTEDRFALEIIVTSANVEGGDSGGPVLSFVSPQDLFLVVVHGIVITRGSSAQSIDTIFRVIKENTGLDLTLYH